MVYGQTTASFRFIRSCCMYTSYLRVNPRKYFNTSFDSCGTLLYIVQVYGTGSSMVHTCMVLGWVVCKIVLAGFPVDLKLSLFCAVF